MGPAGEDKVTIRNPLTWYMLTILYIILTNGQIYVTCELKKKEKNDLLLANNIQITLKLILVESKQIILIQLLRQTTQ